MVAVIRYAVVTHACPARSLRSSAMTRMALATMVWSSAARNIPIIRPMRIVMISRCESAASGASGLTGSASASGREESGVVSDMSVLPVLQMVEGHGRRLLPPGPQVRVERVAESLEPPGELDCVLGLPVAQQALEPHRPGVLDPGQRVAARVGEGD